mgnify:CR=1 FL=1
MKRIFRIAKPVSLVLAIYVFMISGPQQAAFAALVETENVLDASHVQSARERVRHLMAREDIQSALANQGNLGVLSSKDRELLSKEPALCEAYYRAIQEIYWRQEVTARAAQGGTR